MTPGNWIQILALASTLLLFLIPIVYYAGKLVAKMETIGVRLVSLENKVSSFQEQCFTQVEAKERMRKTDEERNLLWGKYDKLKKIIVKLLQKAGMDVSGEDL